MRTNIYRYELGTRLSSTVIWSIAVAAITVLFFSIYPNFADQAALINALWAKFPEGLRAAFGLDRLDMASVLGYYGFLLVFIELCLAIQAGNYGFGLVSIEESELTADFLLTKPVGRARILTGKLLAAGTSLALTTFVAWGSAWASILLFRGGHPYDGRTLLLILGSMPVFQLFFLGVGLAVSLLVKRVRNVTPYSLGLAFGAYVLAAFSGVFGDVKLELLTPFKHLDPATIVKNGAWNTPLVLIDAAVIVATIAASYPLYVRRDISAVS